MKVRSLKNEIINLAAVEEYQLSANTLVIKKEGRRQIYTLTEESRIKLEKESEKIK